MLAGILLIALNTATTDYISLAVKSYRDVNSYSVTLRSESRDGSEIIRYYYKKIGIIKMEFIKPHSGATLIYNHRESKVRVRPFPSLKFFVLTFDPDDRMVKSSRGHRVDQSDIGFLLEMVEELRSKGKFEYMGTERVEGREAVIMSIKGDDGYTVDRDINRYTLWLDTSFYLPLKVEAYGVNGDLLEKVLMEDMKVNVDFEEGP